ncbi:tetratricopeptide repeat protein [Streptomyces puniciscabiei]|uniref:Tetratricopeptide repeat protein n=1 Tax=Streptomyces puniciscabiei TaxID=164348 RepID=A0A542UAZ2_9ACTN|nr:FxSxx-COOH system tetratricopeptide repeat protein [Streptomyces puniciscabiei]TQK96215.1 tetratricopeptide repeat protein [Streptomyces puniciscabiei]
MASDNARRDRSGSGADLTQLWGDWRFEDEALPREVFLVTDAHVTMRVWDESIDGLSRALARSFAAVHDVALLGTDEMLPAGVRTDTDLEADAASDGTRRMILVVTDGLAAGWHLGAVQPLLRRWGQSRPVALINPLPPHLWFRTGLDVLHARIRALGPWAANARWDWYEREVPAAPGHGPADPAQPGTDPDGASPAVAVPVLSLRHHGARALSAVLGGPQPRALDLPATPANAWKGRPDAARSFPWATEFDDSAGPPSAVDRVFDFRAAASPTAFRLGTRLAAAPLTLPVVRRLIRSTPGAGPVHASEFFMSGLVQPTGVHLDAPGAVVYDFLPDTREQLLALGRRSATLRTLREVREVLASDPSAASLLPPPTEPLGKASQPRVTQKSAPFLRIELTALDALSGSHLQRARLLRHALKWHDQRYAVSLAKVPPAGAAIAPSAASGATEGAPPMSTTPQRTVEGERTVQPRVWGNLPPRNQNFTGRTELLDLLEQRLREGTTTVLPEAIHGMGGVGKTQLAIEYAYRHQSQYDIVWWIPSERPGQIGQSLVELAKRLGLVTTSEANIAGPAVREALREGRPYSRWLLIFDNADSPEQVRPYFPTGGTGTILVTSRNRRWGLVGGSLEVDVFTREESKELLRGSGPELADEEAEALAEALGDLPLALVQAAAWRAETGMPASEYLRLFESKQNELLETAPPPDYQLPVAAAWNVSLDHLETRSPGALRLLQLCSYFAPDPISRQILSGPGYNTGFPELDAALNDPMKLARAIREINRYSLARIDHRTNSIEMHRLVQHVLINRMSPEEQSRMREGAHALMASADPRTPTSPESWPRYAELYTHVIASDAITSDQPWVRQLVMNVAKYLWYWGDHNVCLDFSENAWNAWLDTFGEEDVQTLLMGQWLVYVYLNTGRYSDASALVERVRAAFERVSSPDSEESLDIIQTEAAVRRVQGRFLDGAELDRVVYERARRAFGEDDPASLRMAHNLGVSLRLTGEIREALELDRKTWHLKLRLFGRDDQRSLITENSIAIDERESGDYVGALRLQEAAFDAFQDVFGDNNPATISTGRELGIACRKAGLHARALELAIKAHEAFTRRYGDTHPQSLATALPLAIALRQNGDLEAARARGAQACAGYRKVFHAQHPYVLSADVGLAVSERLLGKPEEARRLDDAALVALSEGLGADHPFTLVTAVNLASDLAALGEYEAATARGRDTLARCRQTFGPDHPTTLACAGNLSFDLMSMGLESEAAELRGDTEERMRRVLDTPDADTKEPTPHPATVAFLNGTRLNCDIDPMPL